MGALPGPRQSALPPEAGFSDARYATFPDNSPTSAGARCCRPWATIGARQRARACVPSPAPGQTMGKRRRLTYAHVWAHAPFLTPRRSRGRGITPSCRRYAEGCGGFAKARRCWCRQGGSRSSIKPPVIAGPPASGRDTTPPTSLRSTTSGPVLLSLSSSLSWWGGREHVNTLG